MIRGAGFMRILVIGGSYFFGRWFVQLAKSSHDITVLNRGNIRIGLDGVKELRADRHSKEQLAELFADKGVFDAVVDFCAYAPGDISSMLAFLDADALNRYIFISTVDVYKRGTGQVLSEDSPFEDRIFAAREGEYIAGKVALETELLSECGRFGIVPVSVRPAVLYGPGNYAPRESVYFKWIEESGQILHPEGSDGYWQMIYAADAAGALVRLCEMRDVELKKAYNFCSGELITYDTFELALEKACSEFPDKRTFTRAVIDAQDMSGRGIQMPFPLFKYESEHYSAEAFMELGFELTPLYKGLAGCFKVYGG